MSRAVAFRTKEAAEAAGYELWREDAAVMVYPSGHVLDLDIYYGPDGRIYDCCHSDQFGGCFVFWPVIFDEGISDEEESFELSEVACLGPSFENDLQEDEP